MHGEDKCVEAAREIITLLSRLVMMHFFADDAGTMSWVKLNDKMLEMIKALSRAEGVAEGAAGAAEGGDDDADM